ncbi:HmuY family protein [Chitinophaga rhizophila]|uniref:HmuY family protein n=1 Tax=Chitinophaga rhizophila TaxID=2866212 RepID=A0ABS7GK26_9BACT|nr:HmuY family protein [Chitinophaga rhizophila]MBW8688053.1 HmuY family protein [Chitinophaga rhizophila]
MKLSRLFLVLAVGSGLFTSCSKDEDTTVVIPPSDGSQLTLNGGGGTGSPNTVYVDFSSDSTATRVRGSWNLGFYGGAEYRVTLNSFTAISAVAINKTDISAVNIEDTAGVNLAIGLGSGNFSMIDDVYGDLTKTAIAEISATEANNKVYLVKPENASATDPATWYKIRITRSGNGYALQYAKLKETTIKTATINKDNNFNFTFFSLDNGATVNVEPRKADWDIAWSYGAYTAGPIPYFFSDLVITNQYAGVTAAKVDSTVVSYNNFTEANIAAQTFSDKRDAIGSSWRATTGAGIYKNFFYVVKDANGNYYKLKFVSMGIGDGGTRGYPVIEYKLVKSAN